MNSRNRWGWALPGLMTAVACMAQAAPAGSKAVHKELQQVRKQVTRQHAQARDLQQQIAEVKKRNAADQASLAERDREIAQLKAQLAHKQAEVAKTSSAAVGGKGR